ncbi:hypothetical protein Vafri_1687, partial [Volvox africanus]
VRRGWRRDWVGEQKNGRLSHNRLMPGGCHSITPPTTLNLIERPFPATLSPGPLHSVLVMERCDLGSLADALDNGMFKKAIIAAANSSGPLSASPPTLPRSPGGGVRQQLSTGQTSNSSGGGSPGFTFATSHGGGGGGGSAMRAIYLTLLEVALALRHLHSMNLVHCDVKVANVLLKSSSSDPRGFTCKLSDFGLVNLLRSEEEPHEQEQEQGSDVNGRAGGAASQRQGEAEGRRAVSGEWEGCKPWMRNADAAGTVRAGFGDAGDG